MSTIAYADVRQIRAFDIGDCTGQSGALLDQLKLDAPCWIVGPGPPFDGSRGRNFD